MIVKKSEVLSSIEELYEKIDNNLTNLINSRLSRNTKNEQSALAVLESLMVLSRQELSFLYEYIKDAALLEEIDDE